MDTSLMTERIPSWVWSQIDRTSSDTVVLCGNHAFRWYRRLRGHRHGSAVEFVHPNALNYLPLQGKRVLIIADETEFGRQLHEAFELCRKQGIRSLHIGSAFLNASANAAASREESSTTLASRGGEDRLFAEALNRMVALKVYKDDEDFHREAILGLREQARQSARAPFNADATLVRIASFGTISDTTGGLCCALESSGWWYQPADRTMTLVCRGFSPNSCLHAFGEGVTVGSHRALVKFYGLDSSEATAAPMVHSEMEIRPGALDRLVSIQEDGSLVTQVLRAGMDKLRPSDSERRMKAAYDLISFSFDVELWRSEVLSRCPGLNSTVDMDSLVCYYGRELGESLWTAAQTSLSSPTSAASIRADGDRPGSEDADPPSVDLGLLMHCKSLMRAEFEQSNASVECQVERRRVGLSFAELCQRTGLDPDTMTVAIDVLCELEWTYPFNRFRPSQSGSATVERCYNTTHTGVTGLMVRVIRVLRTAGVPTNLMNLNKAVSYLTQALFKERKKGFEVDPYRFGKQAVFKINDFAERIYLGEFLSSNADTFQVVSGQYQVLPSVDYKSKEKCFNMFDPIIVDAYLEKLVQIYRVISNVVPEEGIGGAAGGRLTREMALAAVVDMLGSSYPEVGFRTLAVNLRRAQKLAEARKPGDAQTLLSNVEQKLDSLRRCEPVYRAVRRDLESRAGLAHVDRVLQIFAFLPGNSPIWVLIKDQIVSARKACQAHDVLARLSRPIALMAFLGNQKTRPSRWLPIDCEVGRFVASVDMRKSGQVASLPSGGHWKAFAQHILSAWAWWFEAEFINERGDERIYAFETEDHVLGFAGAAWVNLNGLYQSLLPHSGFGVGIARGRVVAKMVGSNYSVFNGDCVPFDPIARACELSKNEKRILIDDGTGAGSRELGPSELFKMYVLGPATRIWEPSAPLAGVQED